MMGVLGSSLQMTHAYCVRYQAITMSAYLFSADLARRHHGARDVHRRQGRRPGRHRRVATGRRRADQPLFRGVPRHRLRPVVREARSPTCRPRASGCSGRAAPAPTAGRGATSRRSFRRRSCRSPRWRPISSVTERVATAMRRGQEKLDRAAQKVVALYLRADPHDLFTDMPPPGK